MDKKVIANNMREMLFSKYFEGEGIKLSILMNNLVVVTEKYAMFRELLIKVGGMDWFSSIEDIKEIRYNGIDYLFINKSYYVYIVIDLKNKKSLTEDEFFELFDVNFFIENFSDSILLEDEKFLELYHCDECDYGVEEIVNFYYFNKDIFRLPNNIYYRIDIDNFYTSLNIKLSGCHSAIQLSFMSKDQLLYETLFIKSDLTPLGLQDAITKIGQERVREMFEQVSNIIIPISVIPKEFLDEGLINRDVLVKKR